MIISGRSLRNDLPFIIFFIIFLVVGISIYRDYGISWDEPISRDNNGVLNYDFIRTGDYQPIITGNEKYHGPAFEILLVGIERLCGLKNMQDIYFMRHLVTFFAFALSVLFFYMLCVRYLRSKWLATLGAVFLVLSPRIFADAFYNSKDLVFMSFLIINLYTTLRFLESKNFITALFHAIISAIVIDIRILGVVIPCFTMLILLIEFIRFRNQRKKILIITPLYSCFLIAAIIMCWPVLWHHPVDNFILALIEMSKYPWGGIVHYLGMDLNTAHLPWHYIPIWILISTPFLYSVLFFIGIIFIFRQVILRIPISTFEWLNLYIFFFPLLAIIFLHSIVYDGWRHMYFIYPSFLAISLIGLEKIISTWKKNKIVVNSTKGGLIIYCLFIGFQMVRLHPYENVYFNIIAGKSLNECGKLFEVDYWGLSYKEGLDYILKNDSSPTILICAAEHQPGFINTKLFPESEQARLSFTDEIELSDYFLTSYRFHHLPYNFKADYDVIRDNGIIFSVFDLRNKQRPVSDNKYRISHFINTNEDIPDQWSKGNIIIDSAAYSGKNIEFIDSSTEFSSNFSFNPPSELIVDSTARNYLNVNFQIKSSKPYDALVVYQLDSGNAKMYKWEAKKIQSSLNNTWIKCNYRLLLPKIYSIKDKIKIYIWNVRKNNFCIDDMEINIYSVPEIDIKKIMKTLP